MKQLTLFLLCVVTFVTPPISAQERIDWRVVDWPPFYILNGESKGQGVYDQIIKFISGRLPEYEHHMIEMTTKRTHIQWADGVNICHPSVIVDEPLNFRGLSDDRTAVLSVVNSILLPHELIINAELAKEIPEIPVDIEQLLDNAKLRGGITPERYNARLNEAIAGRAGLTHLVVRSTYNSLNKMLLAGHLDYVIEYAPVIRYLSEVEGKPDLTRAIPFQTSKADSFILAAVGCTNNAWGRKIIERINEILIEESRQPHLISQPHFLESRLRWYNEEQRKRLEVLYDELYFQDKIP